MSLPDSLGRARRAAGDRLVPDQLLAEPAARAATCPVDVQIGGPGPGAGTANYRAFIYVNGWLIGRYVNNVGPQHQFYVPAGHPQRPRLQHAGHRGLGPGRDRRRPRPGQPGRRRGPGRRRPGPPGRQPRLQRRRCTGAPTSPQPTLAAVPSTTLATSTFTVKDHAEQPDAPPLSGTSEARLGAVARMANAG